MTCLKDMIYWHPKLLRYLPSPDSRRGENKTIGRSHHICPLPVNNLTHNYSSRVKERQREKKRTMLFYFTSNIPQEHIAVRTHQSRDSPIECWSTETHCKIELTSTMCGKPTCLCQNVQYQCSGKRLMVCFQIFTVYL